MKTKYENLPVFDSTKQLVDKVAVKAAEVLNKKSVSYDYIIKLVFSQYLNEKELNIFLKELEKLK